MIYNKHYSLKSRIVVEKETAVYHIVNRLAFSAFKFDREEKEMFIKCLRRQAGFAGIEVLTYCVMDNHFHLLVRVPYEQSINDTELMRRYRMIYADDQEVYGALKPNELETLLEQNNDEALTKRKQLFARMGNLSVFMKELKQRFCLWYNATRSNCGTLWSERFRSVLIENKNGALRTVGSYIDLNPVRAGICDDPKDYRWSGYGEACAGRICAREGILEITFCKNWERASQVYRLTLFGIGERPGKSGGKTIDPKKVAHEANRGGKLSLTEILMCRTRYFTDGAIIGSSKYIENIVKNKGIQAKKEKALAYKMQHADWGDLHTMRNLIKDVFG